MKSLRTELRMRCPIGLLALGVAAMLLGAPAKTAQTNELQEAPKLKPNYERGHLLYETCAACHQSNGAGVAEGNIPNIAGRDYEVILKRLVDFRDTKTADPRMQWFASQHRLKGPQDLADVAAFISRLPAQPTQASGLEPFLSYSGADLFQRFCASCHGSSGHGDGPVARSLKVLIPDLTELTQRAGGHFPARRVQEIIDGRAVLPAHGTRSMPVWGYEFEAQVPPDQPGRATAQRLIDRLADYLSSIQR